MSKKILLIDDDIDIVELNRALLTMAGYEVVAAFSGAEGLEKVIAERPDLVILDVMMSTVGEGFEVARQIRKHEAIRHTPILMLTGVNREHPFNLRIGPMSSGILWTVLSKNLSRRNFFSPRCTPCCRINKT